MRYIFTAIVAAVISGLIVGQLFRAAFEKQLDKRIEAVVTSSTLNAIRTANNASSTGPVFHGPNENPHIIGPKGPPPSY